MTLKRTRPERRDGGGTESGITSNEIVRTRTDVLASVARGEGVRVLSWVCLLPRLLRAHVSRLRNGLQRLRLAAKVFDSSHEGILITDAEGRILEVNAAFTRITGYTREDAVGRTPRILQSGRHDADFYAAMRESLGRVGVWKGELWNRRKNGEVYPEWLSISAVFGEEGQLTHYVGVMSDISQRKATEDEIRQLAFYDPLTRLPNRRLLLDRLQQAMSAGSRSGLIGALLFIDLDHFKTLNDTVGHDRGDMLLAQIAERLLGCVRESDTVSRLGGDEFVVMLLGLSDNPGEAAALTEAFGGKILAALGLPYALSDQVYQTTCSIGATLFRNHHDSVDEVMKQADVAMYRAKEAGRNVMRFSEDATRSVVTQRTAVA